ncbi:riboflavin biosynthesis protein RibF [Candidatus Bipolaricaulota bacterium]|nr:riboflavin biosynthesis protein RibF [Candidatus Bipolaricaulota bacterium]TFH11840.1 MAG: riboflavin biosynthesis protein RibF [Candidatus Atribacteria bacterium]
MKQGRIVTIGTFDGMHLGHQAILREVQAQAQAHGLPSLAYAFSVPPRWALHALDEQVLLLPTSAKHNLLKTFVDAIHPAMFESVRSMDPEEFVASILIKQLDACVVVEGETFRFGRDRCGDLDTLRSLGKRKGLHVVGVPSVLVENQVVSSTRIRQALRSGNIHETSTCLGRPPMLQGHVVQGDRLGEQLGFPTANLVVDPHILLPQAGIYLVHAIGTGILTAGLLYVGTHPAPSLHEHRCEVHLLDFPNCSLHGETLEVHILDRIRDDRAFPSTDALRSQIEQDVSTARQRLFNYPLNEERISS